MLNFGVLFALILVSAVPAVAAFAWLRLARYPFPAPRLLISLFVGATSLFAALFLQSFLAGTGLFPPLTSRAGLLAEIFIRIAFTEELSRLLLLAPLLLAFQRLDLWKAPSAEGVSADTAGRVYGLVAGLGFGILESAAYGASNPLNAALRAFTATPLHAACASRVGCAAAALRERPAFAAAQFLSAVFIHGAYNLMIITPGRLAPWVAIFLAFYALAFSVRAIVRGMRAEDSERA